MLYRVPVAHVAAYGMNIAFTSSSAILTRQEVALRYANPSCSSQLHRLREEGNFKGDEKGAVTRTQPSLEPVAIPLLSWLTWRSSTSWRWPCSLHTSEGVRPICIGIAARLRIACSEVIVPSKTAVKLQLVTREP